MCRNCGEEKKREIFISHPQSMVLGRIIIYYITIYIIDLVIFSLIH